MAATGQVWCPRACSQMAARPPNVKRVPRSLVAGPTGAPADPAAQARTARWPYRARPRAGRVSGSVAAG